MTRILAALAIALPAVCIAQSPNSPASGSAPIVVPPAAPNTTVPVPAAPTYRAGLGTVESISLVHVQTAPPAPIASAGGSAAAVPAYRLSVRMDDGTVQSLDQNSRDYRVGDRVEITNGAQVQRR
ncbi:MAG TPA: hypothetical protein VE085_09550 [Burkholderiales bacterium]|nr:hypothetical protein [Burkholderiales bacterium]